MIKKCSTFVSVWKILAGGRGAYKIQIYIMGTAIQQTFPSKGIFIMSLIGFMFLWGAQWMERMCLHSKEFVYSSLLSENEPPPPYPSQREEQSISGLHCRALMSEFVMQWPHTLLWSEQICWAVDVGHTAICSVYYFGWHWSVHALQHKGAAWELQHVVSVCVCECVHTQNSHMIWVSVCQIDCAPVYNAFPLSFIRGSPLCVIVKQLRCIINGSLGW